MDKNSTPVGHVPPHTTATTSFGGAPSLDVNEWSQRLNSKQRQSTHSYLAFVAQEIDKTTLRHTEVQHPPPT